MIRLRHVFNRELSCTGHGGHSLWSAVGCRRKWSREVLTKVKWNVSRRFRRSICFETFENHWWIESSTLWIVGSNDVIDQLEERWYASLDTLLKQWHSALVARATCSEHRSACDRSRFFLGFPLCWTSLFWNSPRTMDLRLWCTRCQPRYTLW